MKTLYVDCQAGISGDMFVAALLDLGASKAALQTALDSLHIDDFKIEITKTSTHGIVCTDYNVILKQDEHEHTHEHEHEHEHEHTHAPHVHRNLYDVEKLIDAGSIPESARKIAKKSLALSPKQNLLFMVFLLIKYTFMKSVQPIRSPILLEQQFVWTPLV